MSGEAAFVFALIGVAAALMASNRVRFDVVALLVVLALMLSGVLSPDEALAGFGSPVVILVAGLLIVGEALDRTGVAVAIGDLILKQGGASEARLLVVIMIGAGVLGAVMSSTAVVAIFIPIVLRIAAETNLNASRLLMPMSYAALISGMLTLIATTPNLVVHEELKTAGYDGFGFFAFAPVGVVVLAVAISYVLLAGRRLLPREIQTSVAGDRARTIDELWEEFRAGRHYESMQIGPNSPLGAGTLRDAELETRYAVAILGIMQRRRGAEERIVLPSPDAEIRTGDVLLIAGLPEALEQLQLEQELTSYSASDRDRQRWLWEIGGATVLIHPDSTLLGKTLTEADFRARYGLNVVGLRRNREVVADYEDAPLAPADSLLVIGPWAAIQRLRARHHQFIVLEMPSEHAEVVPAYRRMPLALVILAVMVLLSIFDVVPLVAAVIMAVLAAVFTRCLTMEDSYRAIHWSSLVLVAGMLPLADALERTGGTKIIVDALMTSVGDSGPGPMLTAIFFLTAALSLFLSNTASAVLVAPIAIAAAETLGVSPYPFAVAVLIAASAAFVTPVSTPVVTLVVEPGRYAFADFVKVGMPLLVLTWLVTLLLAPLVFPFNAP
ncbi:MAG: SLC13 family permease [Gammaproteobacteria bacterium]